MKFTIAVAASNGITITSSMVCCGAYLYKDLWQHLKPRTLVVSTIIIVLTTVMFGLQLAYPEILYALQRDINGLKAGEWWRLVTPLFVQSHGVFQFLFNMVFIIVFLPMAERLYGARTWLLYFVPGLIGQLVNYAWAPNGGGSSTAIFGVMGTLLMYVLLHRKSAPRQYPVFAVLGICGAVVMCFTHDGHGPSLLSGAVLAVLMGQSSHLENLNNVHTTSEDARA
jgi:rhomboid protease GluP